MVTVVGVCECVCVVEGVGGGGGETGGKGMERFEPKFYECLILGLNPDALRSA